MTQHHINGFLILGVLKLANCVMITAENGLTTCVPPDPNNGDYQRLQEYIDDDQPVTVITAITSVGGDEDFSKGFTITVQGGTTINAPGDPTDMHYQWALAWLADGNELTG